MKPEEVPEEIVQAAVDELRENSLWGGWEREQAEQQIRSILANALSWALSPVVRPPLGTEAEIRGRSGRTYREWLEAGARESLTGRTCRTYHDLLREFVVDERGTVLVEKILHRATGEWQTFNPPLRIQLGNLETQIAWWQDVMRDQWAEDHADDQMRQQVPSPSISRLFLDPNLIRDDRKKP